MYHFTNFQNTEYKNVPTY